MRQGKIQVLGSFQFDSMIMIYNKTLSEARTSVIIPNLNGNLDVEYELKLIIVGNADGQNVRIRPNADSETNYGNQFAIGGNTTATAIRQTNTGFQLVYNALNTNQILHADVIIYAKSGYERTAISKVINDISGTTATEIILGGYSWNNTTDNITSLTLITDQANGLGVGTNIQLYARRSKI
jgi:hypothetical protein